jgi:hypothetical protein
MFQRIIFETSSAPFVIAAFVAAATIFVSITWRAIRMPRTQVDRFAHLPFTTEPNDGRHDTGS